MNETTDEVVLTGGNMSAVSRRGDTVLRTAGPWTPTVHRWLRHLIEQGVPGVPQPRGMTDDGRERVQFLPGLVPRYPMPDWVFGDDVLRQATERLRLIHDAGADFDLTDGVWQLPSREPVETVCHNDFAPYNLVFDDDRRLTSVIDWDTASPGSRLWDLAYLGYRLVPLTHPGNPDSPAAGEPEHDRAERRRRLDLVIDGYGDSAITRGDLVDMALRRLRVLTDFTAARADPAVNSLHRHVETYRRDVAWMEDAGTSLR